MIVLQHNLYLQPSTCDELLKAGVDIIEYNPNVKGSDLWLFSREHYAVKLNPEGYRKPSLMGILANMPKWTIGRLQVY